MRPLLIALATTSTLVLGACAGTQMTPAETELMESMDASRFQPSTREMRDNIETQPLLAQATFWQREYELNPGDLEAAIKLAASVRKMGNPQRAIEITQTTRALYPKDPYLVAEFAAALVASERGNEALPVIETALRTAPGYARLWSLRGAALDQAERYADARQSYDRALSITPYDPNILANMGLSFALEGDAATAEQWLVKAAAIPGASASVTRNLDLVRQLQGKTVEPRPAARQAERPGAPMMAAPLAAAPETPGRSFRVFNDGEARSAADVARQMAREGGGKRVLRADDPDALNRLARNASPAARALQPTPASVPMQPRSPFAPQAQGQMPAQAGQPGQPIQQPPQGYPQGYPTPYPSPYPGAHTQAPQTAPQGYPAAYPQGAAPYPQMAPQGAPQMQMPQQGALSRGRARTRR